MGKHEHSVPAAGELGSCEGQKSLMRGGDRKRLHLLAQGEYVYVFGGSCGCTYGYTRA